MAQTRLPRYTESVTLVSCCADDHDPGVCPDCGGDIHGPLSLVPLPDAVPHDATKGWHCPDCNLSVVLPAGSHTRRLGGGTGYDLAEIEVRSGATVTVAVPEGGEP